MKYSAKAFEGDDQHTREVVYECNNTLLILKKYILTNNFSKIKFSHLKKFIISKKLIFFFKMCIIHTLF